MKKVKFRHEIKHLINISDYLAIKNRLKNIAQLDENAGDKGTYTIKSLYFDNINNKALMEKINGVNNREKFRLRIYNDNHSFIKLEKKSKVNGLCSKISTSISMNQCEDIIKNNIDDIFKYKEPILTELYSKMKYDLLRPKTIVEYTREAYVFKPGNIRITFDSNIKSGLYSQNFFNDNLATIGMPARNPIVLEVKFDEFFPEIIRDIIQTKDRESSAFSKYAACRIYE
ncbi:polyphosphate polymerase domain-containing protein [Clostridium sp. UBA4395]|uniref:polyphosphate polymerase domain-containing protein n=1 Tax=Clostridium sp. UBA4395 TaxID=1946360 RepID=UPI003216FB78